MQVNALPRRRLVSFCLSLAIATTTPILHSADIPVRHIILYKHGIGYFERAGTVPEGQEARLDFKNADMNDVLKSLVVTDTSSRHIAGIRYDSNENLEQRLGRFPFKIGDGDYLSAFLDHLKGARVELKSSEHSATGAIMGARAIEIGPDTDKRLLREQITLLLDSGDVANYDLGTVGSLRLLDPRLEEQLKQYLQTLAQSKSRDQRSVYIDSAGRGDRNLHVSYISPTAIWKSSYRLTLEDPSSLLEGWAIVDNTTDEDWNGVKLSVVSGRPISFISLLDTPRYGQRQVFELPEDRAAGPVVYGGTVDVTATTTVIDGAPIALGSGSGNGYGPGSGGGSGGGVYHMGADRNAPAAAAPIREFTRLEQEAKLQSSSVEGATGATLGELFQYSFANLVSIKKNQSAMLSFLQDRVAARKLLIYTDRDSEHPVNAAEITNTTSKTLDGGPITVYESGAYAGEALVETLKAGDKRLIGYAVDYGTRITSAFDTAHRNVREVHVKEGALQLNYGEHQTRTYTIRNVDARQKTLIVQQSGGNEYTVLSPKPSERTAQAYRFEVKLPANGSQTLKVEQERNYYNSTALTSSTPDFLLTVIENKEISDSARRQLRALADLKSSLVEVDRNLVLANTQMSDLTNDQTRLRQNIDSLNRVKGQEDQVGKYSSQLSGNEAQLAKLRDQRRDFTTRKASLESEVRSAIDQLDF